MYSTCLFCHSDLGKNELLETFPVGRRLAFDAEKGRLWVVCRVCRRWNLTPLEARWEAIDQCERLYRGTRRRVSTDQIGLAEVPGRLSLVRVGRPLRPELAAWRYGRQFTWRRWRTGLLLGAGAGAASAIGIGGIVLAAGGLAVYASVNAESLAISGLPTRVAARVPIDGRVLRVKREDLPRIRVFPDQKRGGYGVALHHSEGVELLSGPQARHALGRVLPVINRFGADGETLRDATDLLEESGDADAYVRWMYRRASLRITEGFTQFPLASRLALEMALHEETERRLLEGELADLEQAWRDAEEVAAIADGLLLPQAVLTKLRELQGRLRSDNTDGA